MLPQSMPSDLSLVGTYIPSVQLVDLPDEQRIDVQIVLWSVVERKAAWAGIVQVSYETLTRGGDGRLLPLVAPACSPPDPPSIVGLRRLRLGEGEA